MTDFVSASELLALAQSINHEDRCETCASLNYPGWESLPAVFDQNSLKLVGTLKVEDAPESWEEFHPNGTQIWSPEAPIAVGYHPYNRCDLYQCIDCSRIYLRYTEFGGYYVDQRIRALNAKLIVSPT